MVFTLNTTVFAEEVAVDSVEETADASVDAVDAAEEATVDEATVDDAATDATTTGYYSHLKYTNDGTKSVINAEITYSADPNVKKNAKEDIVKITGVDSPVSWNNIYKSEYGYGYGNPADPETKNAGWGGTALISTVLVGSNEDTSNLLNGIELGVSSNGAGVGDAVYEGYTEKVGNKLHPGAFGAYRVIDLGDDSHYVFVGYGDTAYDIQGEEGLIPVYEYDGRQIAFNKSGDYKYSTSKAEKLDVKAALVEYKDGTLTEIPGVEVAGVKFAKKTGKDATVSGQMNKEKWSYETWDDTEKKVKTVDKKMVAGKEVDVTRDAYKKNAELATFTVSVKVKGKDIDKTVKKAITEKFKNETFKVAIRQKVVDTWLDATTSSLFEDLDVNDVDTGIVKVSDNKAHELTNALFDNTEEFDSADFDDFNISKFNQEKGKATVTMHVAVGDTKKGYKDATIGLKAGTDYDLTDGTLAQSVKVMDFKGNFIYADPSTTTTTAKDSQNRDLKNVAPAGYKWAFRMTPSTDGKKTKTFRWGVYKGSQDGFVYSVDDAAADSVEVDSVEEAF